MTPAHLGAVSAHLSRDIAWLRIGRRVWFIKPPWSRPLFSERYSYAKPLVGLRGWRLFYRVDAAEEGEG